jgi:hypothetical protein
MGGGGDTHMSGGLVKNVTPPPPPPPGGQLAQLYCTSSFSLLGLMGYSNTYGLNAIRIHSLYRAGEDYIYPFVWWQGPLRAIHMAWVAGHVRTCVQPSYL